MWIWAKGESCLWKCTVISVLQYSLRPKMIVILPGFFCPKIIVQFICPARNLRLKVKRNPPTFYIKSLSTPQLPGIFRSSCCILFKSHTYNYSVNGQCALILPKLETRTILLGRREYNVVKSISRHVKNHSSMTIVPHLCGVA